MAVSATPTNDHEDELLTPEEVTEASEPETNEVEGPAVWDDGGQVDRGARDTEVAVEAQVSEKAPHLKAGCEADINRHGVEAHLPFLIPRRYVRYDQALQLEILNNCLHYVES